MDINFFIEKFSDIEDEFITTSYHHWGLDAWCWLEETEAQVLYNIINPFGVLLLVNDGAGEWATYGKNPRDRVIRFLKYVKRMTDKKVV